MNEQYPQETFGCAACWPPDAESAQAARARLSLIAVLIDESHFHVMILGCDRCGQQFISIFTEMVDWADGEDPQYWTLLPLRPPEASALITRGAALTENEINALGRERKCLQYDCPKGTPPAHPLGFRVLCRPA